MHSLRVQVGDETLARQLCRRLQGFDVEAIPRNGHSEIYLRLVERNPERSIEAALTRIEEWLREAGLDAVEVHVDQTRYTLPAAR